MRVESRIAEMLRLAVRNLLLPEKQTRLFRGPDNAFSICPDCSVRIFFAGWIFCLRSARIFKLRLDASNGQQQTCPSAVFNLPAHRGPCHAS